MKYNDILVLNKSWVPVHIVDHRFKSYNEHHFKINSTYRWKQRNLRTLKQL